MDQQQNLQDHGEVYGQEEKGEEDVAGKIFIGGLSWQTNEQTLREHFERYGELTDVALMFDKRSNKPRGFGFVKMKDPEAAEAVMNDDHTIDGRLVDVKRALPRDKAPGPASKSESCKIFVGGLPPDVAEPDFAEYFRKFGPVKDAVVMVDRNTGSSRGFGFITFDQEESVNAVLKLGHELRGKPVEVKRAEPRDSNNNRGGGGGFDSYGQNPYGNRNGGRPRDGQVGRPYGGPSGGRGMGGQDGYGAANYTPNYMGGGRPGVPFNNRFPQNGGGYGGAGFRGGASPYGVPSGYGYPTGAPMNGGMGFYGGAMPNAGAGGPTSGGYGGYGAGAAAPQSGYGGAAPSYGAQPAVRPGESFPAQSGNDFRPQGQAGEANPKGPYDNAAVAAGYANAAMQQMRSQPFPYAGAAPMQGYGGGSYGYAGAQPGQGGAPVNRGPNGAPDNGFSGDQGYGAYRGQGAAEGRAGRTYRPY